MVLAFLLATALGIVIALARISKVRVLRGSAIVYIECLRGTPVLVILFWVYFGLPEFGSWLAFSSFTAAVDRPRPLMAPPFSPRYFDPV